MLRGTGGAWWLPTVADQTETTGGPTPSEITAGQELHAAITEITGLEPSRSPINIPLLKYKSEAQIDGPTQFSQITIGIPDEDGLDTDDDATQRMAALTSMPKATSGVLLLSRTKQVLVADDEVWFIALGIDDQVPLFDLGAAFARTNIIGSPTTPLTKGVVLTGI